MIKVIHPTLTINKINEQKRKTKFTMIIIKTHFIFYFTEILLNVQQGTWRPFWRYQIAEPLQGRHHSGIVQLTVSPDGTDHVRVHELIHDHGVTPGKVTP